MGGWVPKAPVAMDKTPHLFISTPMCSQNLVLSDTFFSFYDLRREFHTQHPSTCSARDLTVGTMAQGI